MNEKLHPVQTQLLNFFSDAITTEEINARLGLVEQALKMFVEEFNKNNPEPEAEKETK